MNTFEVTFKSSYSEMGTDLVCEVIAKDYVHATELACNRYLTKDERYFNIFPSSIETEKILTFIPYNLSDDLIWFHVRLISRGKLFQGE